MTTGGPLYLVSACSSAEEFVAAFRRYADRTGLFVPIASPLPQGRKGRIALTLKDGGVMVEGEAEIVQSSAKSPLHGRAGMLIKFTEPDELSKVVLAELEKARLAMKPSPPSVPPRPADVPAEPRPVPPAIGGRIDAANALAECVVIGDASALKDLEGATPPKAGQKFVVPAIPAMGGRPKTPTAPPEPKPADAAGKAEPRPTTIGMPAIKPPASEPSVPAKAADGKSGPVAVTAEPKSGATAVPAKAAEPRSGGVPAMAAEPKSGATAVPAKAADPKSGATPVAADSKSGPARAPKTDPTPVPGKPAEPSGPAPVAAKPAESKKLTQIGFPAVKLPAEPAKPEPKATTLGMSPLKITETQPTGVVPAPPKVADAGVATNKPLREDPTEPLPMKGDKPPLPAPVPTRNKSGTTPPRYPTPAAPLPVVRMPAKPAPVLDLDEKTDLTSVPLDPVVAVDAPTVDSGKVAPPVVADAPTVTAKPARSGGMRASEILAAVQVDDWTMTPDASAPTVIPSAPKLPDHPKPVANHDPEIPEPTPAPGGPPTGDWTMSLDPAEGWSKPEKLGPAAPPPAEKPTAVTKIDKRIPVAAQTPSTGNPVHAIASDKPIEAVQWEDKPTSVGEKIEIDPTLMEPLKPMPADEELSATNQLALSQTGSMAAYPPSGSAPGMVRAASGSMPQVPMPGDAPPRAANIPPPLSAGVFPPPSGTMPAVPSSTGSQPAYPAPEMPIGFAPTLMPGQMTAPPGPFGYPAPPPSYQPYQSDSVAAVPMRSNKRKLVIIASAAAVVVLALVLVLTLGGHKKKQAHGAGSAGSAVQLQVVPPMPIDAAVAQVAMPDAAAVEGPGSAQPQVAAGSDTKSDTCNVEVTTNPAGAEVSLDDKTVLGTTPGTFALPCGTAAKLYLKKAKFLTVIRSVTPAPDGTKVAATLGVAQFSVRITSTPAGATITVGGKSKGVTPTAVQLPAFTTQVITLTKDGYQTDTQKVVIKSNGLSHHVVLKKGGKHH